MIRAERTTHNSRHGVPDKREAILRAATRVFAANGYANSKVADIARSAGVADGTVYLYFKSKEEILHSIFDRHAGAALAEGKRQLAELANPVDKLRRAAQLHLELLGADKDLAIVFQVELRGTIKFIEEFSAAGLAEYLRLIRAAIEEGQASGVFRRDMDAGIASGALFGALDEMATNWILSKRKYKLAPMADAVLDIFLKGVSAS